MNRDPTCRTLALAGVFQAAELVQQVARHGRRVTPAVQASIHSLFMIDAVDAADVFGGVRGIAAGLRRLQHQLGDGRESPRDPELTRYAVAMLFLERKLSRRPKMLRRLRAGIETAAGQADYFSETHANVVARLGDLYRDTISTMTPRIMVSGEAAILSNPDNAALIRALLLAGIRAAVLWHQCGGNRWQLLLRRRRILHAVEQLIASLPATSDAAEFGD
jgi:high frequency lysogenization protein